MADIPSALRPTIFLDTNALHYMLSYLQWAKREDLPPFRSGRSLEQARDILRQRTPKSIADILLQGAKTLFFLQQQVDQHDAEIYASRFAKAEVIYGVLEGQAHARMAREGLPYRMRQRMGVLSELVSMYLESQDYQQVIVEWDKFLGMLEDRGGIVVLYVEDEEEFMQIAELAEFLQSRVFMDVVDSWMYACALVTQSEWIITFDRYFRRMINKLHNPSSDADWQQLHDEFQNMLRVKLPGEPTLPKYENPPQSLPNPW